MHRSAAISLGVVPAAALAAGWLWCLFGLELWWLRRASLVLGVVALAAFSGTFATLGVLLVIDPALKRVSRAGMLVIFGAVTLALAWGLLALQGRIPALAWLGTAASVVGALVIPACIVSTTLVLTAGAAAGDRGTSP